MTSLILAAGATIALAFPTFASAQDVKTVYRPEVHGTVIVVPQDAAPQNAAPQNAAPQHATHQATADAQAPAAAKHQCCEKKMSAMADMKKP